MKEELTSKQEIRRKTIKAFVGFGVASLVPVGIWKWIKSSDRLDYLSAPLRKTLEFNEKLTSKLLSNSHLAPIFSKSQAERKVRFNGAVGLQFPLSEDYKIQVQSGENKFEVTINDLKTLPKQEIIFEFKCIEGWSQIQHWGGVRFVDFMNHYKIGQKDTENLFEYVAMETPDGLYYVGVDMPSAVHPQTILAYEMNGKPLLKKHGSPLRLIIPVKYGYKSLKRVGKISFSDERPKDYWASLGYDYFAGL
ncbi:DMSO/TMAO reductase YedYZ molybdopterin-dependent catalytic subunit [Arcicella aurantiaca]|uniref:DMSO/TMAO reductase YedYZ molybdopterin-dependent catalytic subunit n=1 Tax=Arcicella aurantiaca TaxID=591202 RepID=A0A316EG30_9BACT|nr:molybdopterin-dependent oxidoreductase [Arcicella aurantiaca]PWK28653.1 DMSO/TMAO reductase YedYZ molybdopterin-dependent catalytic subunit [Arcicella aurantiaca]